MSKSFASKLTDEIAKLSYKKQFKNVDEAMDYLRSQGVKDAELEYSGIRDRLGVYDKTGMNVSPAALGIADSKRPDVFEFDQRPGTSYDTTIIPSDGHRTAEEIFDNPSEDYREFLYRFSNDEAQRNPDNIMDTRSISSHFEDEPNYMGHVRTLDEIWDGEPVLNVQEVQSDVLGHALKQGSPGADFSDDITQEQSRNLYKYYDNLPKENLDLLEDELTNYADEVNEIIAPLMNNPEFEIMDYARNPEQLEELFVDNNLSRSSGLVNPHPGPGPNRFPNTKNYRERMLERAMDVAQSEGKTKLAVPLDDLPKIGPQGADKDLVGLPASVETMDEFYNTIEHMVERQDMRAVDAWHQLVREPVWQERLYNATGHRVADMDNERLTSLMGAGIDTVDPHEGFGPIQANLHRGSHIQKQEYDPKKGRVPKALKKIARDQGMEYSTIERKGATYGVLDFKGKKKKPTELYSLGGMFSLGTLNQLMQDPPPDA